MSRLGLAATMTVKELCINNLLEKRPAMCVSNLLEMRPAMDAEDFQEGDVLFFDNGMIGCVTKVARGYNTRRIALVNKNGWTIRDRQQPFLNDWLSKHQPYAFERDGAVVQLISSASEALRKAA